MSRLTLLLALLVGLVGGGLAATVLRPDEAKVRAIAAEVVAATPAPSTGLDQTAVERIVAELLDKQKAERAPQSEAALDAARLNPMIEDYLLGNPRILQRVSIALEAELTAAKKAETSAALAELRPAIYEDPRQIVLGNPDGDVTLIEMFDYNCGYCRQALPDIAALLDEDPNLKVVLKEFPILSQNSVDAARVAVQVADADVDYWTFHQALFTSRGQIDKAAALKAAADLGLNPITLEMGMNTPEVAEQIEMTYRIAQRLDISGTPTFIIGDEVIPGAIGIDQLRLRIRNMRACGSTSCPAT
ncbi:MAG: DsbA family protein [Devosia sp.]|nr:DsbA family protein [Devosia sp.]